MASAPLLFSTALNACRAPYLFAAVLQQTGAGPQLLPLLADPARAAFQGLSIIARHNRVFHVYPFLQVTPLAAPALPAHAHVINRIAEGGAAPSLHLLVTAVYAQNQQSDQLNS